MGRKQGDLRLKYKAVTSCQLTLKNLHLDNKATDVFKWKSLPCFFYT